MLSKECKKIFEKDYEVPKCPKHKTFCEIAVSSGRGRLGKKSYGFYCNKCQDEWVVAMELRKHAGIQ